MIQELIRNPWFRPVRSLGRGLAGRWPWPVSARLRDGRRMFVDLRSGVGRAIFAKGEFDPAVFEPLRAVLKPGGTFLDIGANVGYYSMMALDLVGASGHVHAFEIDPRPLRCLRRTIQSERISNWHLHELALGDTCGMLSLMRESDSGHSWVQPKKSDGNRVPVATLDEWYDIFGRPRIDAVKIDVEGFEPAVLRGAKEVLTMQRPLVVCEAVPGFSERHGFPPDATRELLESFGYTTSLLDGAWSPTLVGRAR